MTFNATQYNDMIDQNYHSEAAFYLVSAFGTKAEAEMVKQIVINHSNLGHIEEDDYQIRNLITRKYRNKI